MWSCRNPFATSSSIRFARGTSRQARMSLSVSTPHILQIPRSRLKTCCRMVSWDVLNVHSNTHSLEQNVLRFSGTSFPHHRQITWPCGPGSREAFLISSVRKRRSVGRGHFGLGVFNAASTVRMLLLLSILLVLDHSLNPLQKLLPL